MSRSRSASSAPTRALVVLIVLSGALIGTAGTSLAAAGTGDPTTSGATVPSVTLVAGMSLGTLSWALVGLAVLVLGFIAASRSGRRDRAVALPGFSGNADRVVQPSARDAQGEPTAAAVVV